VERICDTSSGGQRRAHRLEGSLKDETMDKGPMPALTWLDHSNEDRREALEPIRSLRSSAIRTDMSGRSGDPLSHGWVDDNGK